MALQLIVQIQLPHLSMRSFEAESSAEGQQTRGHLTVFTSTTLTSIFWAVAHNQVFKEKPNSIDSLVQCVKSFAEGYSHKKIV